MSIDTQYSNAPRFNTKEQLTETRKAHHDFWFASDCYMGAFNIAKDKDRQASLIAECRTALCREDAAEVIRLADLALKNDERNAAALHLKARAYEGLGEPSKAIGLLNAAILIVGRAVDLIGYRGKLFFDSFAPAWAVRDYDEVLSSEPNNVDALVGRARANLVLRELPKALEDCKRAELIAPHNPAVQWVCRDVRERCSRKRC